jgi:hypothetical protein
VTVGEPAVEKTEYKKRTRKIKKEKKGEMAEWLKAPVC